jgi:hypothetical protein
LQNLAVRSGRASNGEIAAAAFAAANAESVRHLTQTPVQRLKQYGKAKRTWTFAEPQSASRSGTYLKSKNEAPAALAGGEEFPKTRRAMNR